MSIYLKRACREFCLVGKKISFRWTFTHYDDGVPGPSATTTGSLWSTGTLSFNDDNMYSSPIDIRSIDDYEIIENIRIKKSILGIHIDICTRFEP